MKAVIEIHVEQTDVKSRKVGDFNAYKKALEDAAKSAFPKLSRVSVSIQLP
jgi:hypothetical protein